MFAKPGRIAPNCRVADVDHTFTTVGKKLYPEGERSSNSTPRSTTTTSSQRTGDGLSYAANPTTNIYVSPKSAKRMYRILAYSEDKHGRKVFFDLIDGKIFGRGPGLGDRISHNVVLFESKEAAMSERFPYNQIGASRGGNGTHPRLLISFDAWGQVRRRYGGGASYIVEKAKIMKIIQFLDPPFPVPKRLVDRYVEPFFFTPADRQKPNREISPTVFKVNKFFQKLLSPEDE